MNDEWGLPESCMIIDEARVWMIMFDGQSSFAGIRFHDDIVWWTVIENNK